MRRLAQVGLALGGVAVALGWAAKPAQACSGGCASDLFWVDPTLPANGALIASYGCKWGSSCSPPDTLDITHAQTGAAIAGELVVDAYAAPEGDVYGPSGARYVFRPEQPFEVGTFYRVKIAGVQPSALLDTEMLVQASAPADLESAEGITVEIMLNRVTLGIGERTCCDDPNTSAGGPLCHAPRAATALQPVVWLDGPNAGQWRERVRLLDGSGAPGELFGSDDVITAMQGEYCFEVELESAVDGRIVPKGTTCTPSDGTVLEPIELECEGDSGGAEAESGGCSVRPSARSSVAGAWSLAALVALAMLRRRR